MTDDSRNREIERHRANLRELLRLAESLQAAFDEAFPKNEKCAGRANSRRGILERNHSCQSEHL